MSISTIFAIFAAVVENLQHFTLCLELTLQLLVLRLQIFQLVFEFEHHGFVLDAVAGLTITLTLLKSDNFLDIVGQFLQPLRYLL